MQALKNREVFARDPSTTRIPNDGVAKILAPETDEQWEVLRYELQSFVCDGEYGLGLDRVLSAFLENLPRPQQPAVWVSGFYGSGKSHFVRVLEQLWCDRIFPDGVLARSLVPVPKDIRALFVELSRLAKQEGGLWTAAGKLSAGDRPIKLDLLAILFRSAGLPEHYPAARFVLWLKENDWLGKLSESVKARGRAFETELRNMYVSPALAEALLEVAPQLGTKPADVHALLREQYPNVPDVSDDEFRGTMAEVLALQSTTPGKLPLTLLVFDELQQAIGESGTKALDLQAVVEMASAQFGSHLLFVGTGQSELEAFPQLSKLKDRFTVRVSLSDSDVEKVVREVVLRKAEDKKAAVKQVLDAASGEIDRHLAGTRIGSRPEDVLDRVADYPLLPVRRRFWERVLRSVDRAGAAAQLRTQLRVVHDAAAELAEKPIGTVVPGDNIYWLLESEMLQTAALQREMAAMIRELGGGTSDRLESRLAALIWLISRLPADGPLATGLRPTADTLADLLVDDLGAPSASLRQHVRATLDQLAADTRLMLVSDEYRLQTRESTEWERDYATRRARILADDSRIASDRATALKNHLASVLKDRAFVQGTSKATRKFEFHFGSEAPRTDSGDVPVWIRDEWSVSEKTVREDAQAAGVDSPIVFVFLPRIEADELKQTIARTGAARDTVDTHPAPETQGGKEARIAMESRAQVEAQRLSTLVGNIVKNARVYMAGGAEVIADDFPGQIREAVNAAVVRLFPRFSLADQTGWDPVVTRAIDGAADPLAALGYGADVDKHPACQEVRTYVGGAGKKGLEVQKHFDGPLYGWPKDAVNGCLLALLAGGFLRASRNGQPTQARGLIRSQIGPTDFFSEGITISALQRIGIRNLSAAMGLPIQNGEEPTAIPRILERLASLAEEAGGDPPLPERPDTSTIAGLQQLAGNEQFVAVHDQKDRLAAWQKAWSAAVETIQQQLSAWRRLEALAAHANGLAVASDVMPEIEAILRNRALLDLPDPVPPLAAKLASALRQALGLAHTRLREARDGEVATLETSEEWTKLKPEDRERLIRGHGLLAIPPLDVGTDEALLSSLSSNPLGDWEDRIAAIPTRASRAREEAARLIEPKSVTFRPPPATLKTDVDVKNYVTRLESDLLERVTASPILIV